MAVAIQTARKRLGSRLVVSMDFARAAAAIYVVLHHTLGHSNWPGGVLFRFGQEAVIVFFLLSGFLIFANESDTDFNIRGYFLRRLLRIYPPLLVAMLLSSLIAIDNGRFAADFHWRELIGTIVGVQDESGLKPGVIVAPYLGNAPLWSLSYEVFFYAVFPFVLRRWRSRPGTVTHVIGAVSCLAYLGYAIAPNHWLLVIAYFLLWWAGAMAAHSYLAGGRSVAAMLPTFGWLLGLCVIAAGVIGFIGVSRLGVYPVLPFRHFAIAILMLALLYGPIGRRLTVLLQPLGAAAELAASVSYGIYVFHYPLLIQWRRAATPFGFAVAVLALVVLSYGADRHLSAFLRRCLPRRRKP